MSESAPSSAIPEQAPAPTPEQAGARAFRERARSLWSVYRTEVILFVVCFFALASFSGQRFLRQSEAPHFIYQAQSWLDGRLDIDPEVLPNLEDWACVRVVSGEKRRCEGRPAASDTWYVSFPPFPAVLMLPFVALHGYQFNDTSFTVLLAALAIAAFYHLLRHLSATGETDRSRRDNVLLALTLAFGSVFFSCAIRGEVWFTAEILGVLLTALYLRCAVRAQHPLWAGLFLSMAALTRTPLLFSAVFFLFECLAPGPNRLAQLRTLRQPGAARAPLRKLVLFCLGAAPLFLLAAGYNQLRFGSVTEFGHRFLFNNRVNADIDRSGLFSLAYLPRNLEAAFLLLPRVSLQPLRLDYDPRGLSLLLTFPALLLLLAGAGSRHPPAAEVDDRGGPAGSRRLAAPLWATVAVCALPGLFYQNTGYMQFGFRFSLDYTPHLILLLALTRWRLLDLRVAALLGLGFWVNLWGAVAFRGYTELMR